MVGGLDAWLGMKWTPQKLKALLCCNPPHAILASSLNTVRLQMGAYESIWVHTGVYTSAYACIWLRVDAYGCIWVHMGAYGCIPTLATSTHRSLFMRIWPAVSVQYGCIWVHSLSTVRVPVGAYARTWVHTGAYTSAYVWR